MGRIGKSQFLALKFDRFDALASALEARAGEREQEADELARDVENPQGAGEWAGAAGRAAQGKCAVIAASMKKQSSTEQGAASAARACGSSLQWHKDVVVGMLDDIEQQRPFVITYKGVHKDFGHAKVGEDWKVVPPPVRIPGAPADVLQSLVDALLKIDQDDLDTRLKAFFEEDEAQAERITQAADFDQVASGDALAGETPEQAKKDAEDVLNGTATEDEKKRVAAATNLNDEQMAALKNGDTVALGPEAWSVVCQMQRAMDGKSPDQIKAMIDKLPPDQRDAFVKSLQLASNPNVGSGAAAPRPDTVVKLSGPQHGGEAVLPDKIKAELDRNHVQENHGNFVSSASMDLFGVHNMGVIADLVKDAPPGYKQGSDLDRKVLGIAAEYTHAYEMARTGANGQSGLIHSDEQGFWDENTTWSQNKHDPLIQSMLSAVGPDHQAVHDAVSDPAKGQQFLHDMTQHLWQDHGKAAGGLFDFAKDAHVGPGVGEHQAQIAGETMSKVADYIDGHRNELMKIPDVLGKTHTIGEVNGDLTTALGKSLGQYWPQLAGGDDPSTRGFEFHQGDDRARSVNIASIIDSNQRAAQAFNSEGMASAIRLQQEAAASLVAHPDDPSVRQQMNEAGKILGIMDKGLLDEARTRTKNDFEAAKWAYESRQAAFSAVDKTLGTVLDVPGGALGKLAFDSGKEGLKDWLVGKEPKPPADMEPANYQHTMPSQTEQTYLLASAMQTAYPDGRLPNTEQLQQHGLLDDQGHLKPYNQLSDSQKLLMDNELYNWLNHQQVGGTNAGAFVNQGQDAFTTSYNEVNPPAHGKSQ